MDLQKLATDLRSKVSDQKLTLDNSIIQQDSFAFVLSYFSGNTIPVGGLVDPQKQIAVSDDKLTISGTQSLFGLSINIAITLTQTDPDTLSSNYATGFSNITFNNLTSWDILPSGVFESLPVPPLPFDSVQMDISSDEMAQNWTALNSKNTISLLSAINLSLSGMGFGIQRSPNPLSGGYDISFSLTGTFKLGSSNLTVSALVPVGQGAVAGQWSVSLSSTSTLADGIADLTQIVFGNNLFASLPPGFQDALSFTITKLLIVFSIDGSGVKYIQIAIDRPADKPWEVVSGFSITGAGARFSISKSDASYLLDTNLYGKFLIGKQGGPTQVYLEVFLSIPSGKNDWLADISGSIENNNINDVFNSLPAQNGQSLPAFPIGLSLEKITLEYLRISFNPSSKTLTYVDFSVTSVLEMNIFDLFKVRDPFVALDIQNPTLSTQRTMTGNVGGVLEVAGVPFYLLAAKPAADKGWTLSAGMQPGTSIAILDLVKYFLKTLNITSLPDWVNKAKLDITAIFVSVYVPSAGEKDQTKKYHVEGTVQWAIDVNAFVLPELTATVKMDYLNGKASGDITVAAKFLGLPFNVGYKFGTPDTEVYLEWLGIQADYKYNKDTDTSTITITFADMSLGEIITKLIESFEPGFTLPAPWNGLNSINLSGLSLVFTKNKTDESKNKIVIVYNSNVNLVFLEISKLTITKDDTGVFVGFEGKFLGIPITSESTDPNAKKLAGKGSDVRDLGSIPVSGMGTQYFDLDYLGLGQKVQLYPYQDLKTVDQAITNLKSVFKAPAPVTPGKPPILPIKVKPATPTASMLIYSDESNWLVATKFTIIEAITLGVVFNDPILYGLLVKLDGDKMKALNGLSFQILYKKVTDSVGVYQIELKLPDSIRELQFGAVSVTLPIIGIDIYTNGSFKLDFGFPYNMDFSRSLTIQAFPFTGSGGFYFAYLSNVPSKNVPQTKVGIFNPIIEFGLGLQLGIGKSINKGILKAGFSITVVGIFEGVIAFYTPNQSDYPGKGDTYYKVSATVGLVGRLYGEINFAIISASLDVTVYAYVQMVVEAYRKIPIYLEAGVSVSLRVSINLGLFSISINLRFSTTVSASFTIGSDSAAPWDYLPPSQAGLFTPRLAAAQPVCPSVTLNWQPLILTDAEKADQLLSVYFFPQLTVAASGNAQAAQFANVLYIDSPPDKSTTDASLNKLVKGILYWCINAAINTNNKNTTLDDLKKENVSVDILKQVFAYLSDTSQNPSPVPYQAIEDFMKAYFTINVMDPDHVLAQNEGKDVTINASILPLFPMLNISWKLNGNSTGLSTYNVDQSYITDVENELKKLRANYQNAIEKELDTAEQTLHGITSLFMADAASQSMPAFVFQDYVLMAAKSALQDAINEFELLSYPIDSSKESLKTLADHFNLLTYNCGGGTIISNSLTPAAIATANSSVTFNSKLTLKIPGLTYQVQYLDNLQGIADKYKIQVSDLNNDDNNAIQGLIAVDTPIQITGFEDYKVAAGQTIAQIAKSMKPVSGKTEATTAQVIAAVKDKKVLLILAQLTLPDLAYATTGSDNFETISTYFGVSIDAIAGNADNAALTGLFNTGVVSIPGLNVLNVENVVSTFDTTDNIARISAMTARYFLHGMRLPIPTNLKSVSALYSLTGQQFGLPTVKGGDDLHILLNKTGDTGEKCWMKFNGVCDTASLDVKISDNTISRINDLITITLDPDTSPLPPQALPMGKSVNETFTLKPGYNWQYPGKLTLPIGTPPDQLVTRPSIWNFSDALISKLLPPAKKEPGADDLGLELLVMEKDPQGGFKTQSPNYAFSTIVEVDIQKIVSKSAEAAILDNAYEVTGANDTGIVLLERLIQYINANNGDDTFIQQIQVLYPPDNTGKTPSGLQSADNSDITLALVQSNLSTETNPIRSAAASERALETKNTLNTFKQFLSYLWQCSITRTGGYYLYYKTGDGNGLPSTIFSKSNAAKIYVLVTYKASLSVNFVNSATITNPISQTDATVYVKADQLTTFAALTTPGNSGFMLERKKPADYVPVEPYPIPATPASHQQDINYLNYQYNLVGFQLIENNVFNGVNSLLPVGPLNEHDPAEVKNLKALPGIELDSLNWKYSSLIPLAKNVKDSQRINPVKTNYPPAVDDPYAGIGNSVNVRLNWQDMFGNTINTTLSDGKHDVVLKSLYSDNLLPVSQWPNVTSFYYFNSPGGKTQLEVSLVLDPARYTVTEKQSKDDVINNAKIDMVTYQKAYYQLIQRDIKITLESSINAEASPNNIPIDAAVLSGFAGDIWIYLSQVVANPQTATPPANLVLKYPVELKNSQIIFELTVALSINRTANVDPAFSGVPAVSTAITSLKPATSDPSPKNGIKASEQMQSLTAFATDFEAAFKDKPATGNFLKIAVGLDRESNVTDDKKIWVVHFDSNGKDGVYYTIDNTQQYFFAPQPLANSLETYDKVTINHYKSGESYPYGASESKTFSDIDLDNWGRACLEAIDLFLTAEYAVPAFLIDNGVSLQKVLDAKELIAEGIAGNVDNIIDIDAPDKSSLDNAREKLRQQLLIQLSNSYKINTIVQNAVNVSHGFTGKNTPATEPPFVPQMYGDMNGTFASSVRARHAVFGANEKDADQYTLSTARIPLGSGPSWLTYLFEAKEADKHSSFKFSDMVFKVSYIEHQIDKVKDMGEYRASSWLSLIIPLEAALSEVGPVEIPIALRSYPTPPSLVNQQVDYAASGGKDKTTTLQQAVKWGYDFNYLPPLAGQDQVNLQLQFNYNNQSDNSRSLFYLKDGGFDPTLLPATLANFISAYPAIKTDLVNTLIKSPTDPVAIKAVQAFGQIIKQIGDAWTKWRQVKEKRDLIRKNALTQLPTVTYNYDVIEFPKENLGETDLAITVTPIDSAPPLKLTLPGFEGPDEDNLFYKMVGSKKVYLKYDQRNTVQLRNAALGDLSILERQNAWSGAQIVRNADLIEKPGGGYKTTNGNFIYKTPLVKFFNESVPLLVCNETIPIAEIENPGKPAVLNLAKHMQNLFKTLLQNANKLDQTIKVECLYLYNITGNDDFNQITIPVLLVAPLLFKYETDWEIGAEGSYCQNSKSFVCNLTTTILGWFSGENPWLNNGCLQFVIEIYGADNSKQPILKLNNAMLEAAYIKDLPK